MKNRYWAGFLLAQFVLYWILSKISSAAKAYAYFFELQKNIHQFCFSWIPFSVGDIFYTVLVPYLLYAVVQLFNRKKRTLYLRRILVLFNFLYFIYQLFWGSLYYQPPLIDRLSPKETTIEDAKLLTNVYLQKCLNTRKLTNQTKSKLFEIKDLEKIKKEIITTQINLPKIITKKPTTSISIKPSLFGGYMNYSGILGYYNPFTAEAQFNQNLPDTYIPFTIAHESAHQLGYAREQEANFVGYLIGINSNNTELKYSTEFFVLKSLLNYVILNNEEDFAKEIISQFSQEMKKDLQEEKDFRKKHSGKVDDFFGFTNDVFLKFNQQEGSITYSYFIDLLLKYELYSEL